MGKKTQKGSREKGESSDVSEVNVGGEKLESEK